MSTWTRVWTNAAESSSARVEQNDLDVMANEGTFYYIRRRWYYCMDCKIGDLNLNVNNVFKKDERGTVVQIRKDINFAGEACQFKQTLRAMQ